MNLNKFLVNMSLSLLLISTVSCQSKGKIRDQWETENGIFKIRAIAYEEVSVFLPGTIYVFQSSLKDSNEWKEILTFRIDDPGTVQKNRIRFLSPQVGYLFEGWVYAVTTDGGVNWSIWNAEKDLPNWECCNYSLIQEVVLSEDGRGEMILKPIPNRRGEVPKLFTKDFGKSWTH